MGQRNAVATLYDFDLLAGDYDCWYDTPMGTMYDCWQKSAVLKLLPQARPSDRLLDVGCGTGHWSHFFSTLGFDAVGIDVSPKMIAAACAKNYERCRFEVGDALRLPFGDGIFSVVSAITALEFIRDAECAVAEMVRCVQADGVVIVGTLNKDAPTNRRRIADDKSPYSSARLFCAAELRALLEPFGWVWVGGTGSHWPESTEEFVVAQLRPGRSRRLSAT